MDNQDLSRLADSVSGHQAWEAALMFDLSDLGGGSATSNLMLAVPPNKIRLLYSTLIRGKKKLAEQHPLSVDSTLISCELATSRKRKYHRFKGYHEK